MKLLITTQAVDRNDPVLGFFHRWIEEFAKHCEQVTVICLRAGDYTLPPNVEVLSLGKEVGHGRLSRGFLFLRLIIARRKDYDAVFVHMNPEYVVLGGLLWRLWGKQISLWYTHKSADLKLRIAAILSNIIFTASTESFRLPSKKLHVVGHGIDTDFFTPDGAITRSTGALSVGRLSESKRHDLAIRAAALAGCELRIAGEGPERANLESLARTLGTPVRFLGGLTQDQLRDEYQKAGVLIHTSQTGSLDKVVLEALATNTPVITTSGAYREFPVQTVLATAEDISRALRAQPEHRNRREAVQEDHSLQKLIPAMLDILQRL